MVEIVLISTIRILSCTVQSPWRIGDGMIDGGEYNTIYCGLDGGDCFYFNAKYSNCNVQYPSLINNGNCDGGAYNAIECGFDGVQII